MPLDMLSTVKENRLFARNAASIWTA